MPTTAERKALLFFSVVLVLGASNRAYRTLHSGSPADSRTRSALEAQIKAADSARRSGLRKPKRERKQKAPLNQPDPWTWTSPARRKSRPSDTSDPRSPGVSFPTGTPSVHSALWKGYDV